MALKITPFTRKIIYLWLAWAAIVFLYQEIVPARFDIGRPDYAREWTAQETTAGSQKDKPFLNEPFLNTHVAWDSEFYLQQAVNGPDDLRVRVIKGPGPDGYVSLSYAFYPLYGAAGRLLSIPLGLFNQNPIATATLSTLLISLLGTLFGMLALADLARPWLDESGALRAAFYLLIFPTGFFLAQVYTEGLFIGLAFSSLALARRNEFKWAGLLAALAVWTRAVGALLVIPLAWQMIEQARIDHKFGDWINRELVSRAVFAALPVISYAGFWVSLLGERFRYIEEHYFGRGVLIFEQSIKDWEYAFSTLTGDNSQAAMYNTLEIGITLLALVCALALIRKHPDLALFGIAAWVMCVFSGSAQSISRYVLVMPTTFLALAYLGKREVFDKAWTLASVLLMGIETLLYTFKMWVG